MSCKDMKETQVQRELRWRGVMQRHEGDTSRERELRWRDVMQRYEGDTSTERTEVESCHAKT